MFAPATREKLKARLAIDGPSGSGKTYTALRLGFETSRRCREKRRAAAQRKEGAAPE